MAPHKKRIGGFLFLALMAVLPAYFLAGGVTLQEQAGALWENEYFVSLMETAVRERMPAGCGLEQLGLDLRLLGGQREQNGIYISDKALMKNIDGPTDLFVRQNTEAIAGFARILDDVSNSRKQTYLAVIPTAAGVLQQYLPRFAVPEVNQQRTIEELYSMVSADNVRTVDVYSVLQGRRDQYIFYRTENNLTALGGFYVYTAIGRRMGLNNRTLARFEIDYVDHAYYGDLYQAPGFESSWRDYATAPYRNVGPDILSLFRYTQDPREYTVTHIGDGEKKVYHTLFPEHLMELGNKMDVYLGGSSAVTEIRTSSPKKSRLLVLGDKTAAAYLPFLVNHYQQVTLVNLYYMSAEEIGRLRPDQFDEVLFAYGIETFISTNHPSRVSEIGWVAG